jgi:hypothetical protein
MSDLPPEPRGHILFSGDDRLEGILEWPESRVSDDTPRLAGGIVVAHPHPLYGGTMAQPVVHRVAQACRERGFASLRFNFRGVGRSGGRYSGTDEHRDVEAALAFLRGRLASHPQGVDARLPLGLAGYSFGSVMAALAAGTGAVPVDSLVLIAFVTGWEEAPPGVLGGLARYRGPVLAVCGELDDLAPPEVVKATLEKLGIDFRLTVVKATGHLFEHRQREVGGSVAAFFAETLGGRWLSQE